MPGDTKTVDDLELRRRRALYRARHRGTKEMDWLVGRFAEAHLAQMEALALDRFEKFLESPDDELQHWIMQPSRQAPGDYNELIEMVRTFHGLT